MEKFYKIIRATIVQVHNDKGEFVRQYITRELLETFEDDRCNQLSGSDLGTLPPDVKQNLLKHKCARLM